MVAKIHLNIQHKKVCDFETHLGTCGWVFSIITESYDEKMPHTPDPTLQVGMLYSGFRDVVTRMWIVPFE